jgi:hypothetical protein
MCVAKHEQKINRDSSIDDEDMQNRSSEETYNAQRTRTIDRDEKNKNYTTHQRMTKLTSQAQAGSDQIVIFDVLTQRAIGSENNSSQLATQFTKPPPMKGQDYFSAAADKLAKESTARAAS